ncbi:MAG: acyl-CoA dehydrogenase family protein [Gammaproteobacteria bacterium]|nr:acyl-CoA dehydrogenase family protein [Gammaproteobacteria bacterium]
MLQFDRVKLPEDSETLRRQVRAFIEKESAHLPRPNSDFSTGHDPEFSAKLGARGWIGMTWPESTVAAPGTSSIGMW